MKFKNHNMHKFNCLGEGSCSGSQWVSVLPLPFSSIFTLSTKVKQEIFRKHFMIHSTNWFLLILISILWTISSPFAGAQTPDSLVARMIRQNPKLQAIAQEYKAASFREGEFKDFPDPVISTGFFPLPVETRLGPQQLKIGISQTLPWNNVLENRAKVAHEEAERLQYEYGIARADLVLTVQQLNARIWRVNAEIDLLEQRFPLIEAWYRVALSRMEANIASASDVLRIQLFLNQITNLIQLLEKQRKTYELRLERIMAQDNITSVDLSVTGLADTAYLTEIETGGSLSGLPDLQWYDQKLRISDAILERNKTEGLPTLGIGLDYVIVGPRKEADPLHNGRDIVMPMLSVKMPVYRKKYKAVEQREKARQVAISLRKYDKTLDIRNQIEEARVLIRKEIRNLEFYEDQLEILERTISMLNTTYSTKGDQFDELLQLQNQLIDFALKQLESRVNIYLAKLTISRWQP